MQTSLDKVRQLPTKKPRRISPSDEYSGLISFRMDWFYLLAVQGTLNRLLQYHSSKASVGLKIY